MKKLFVMLSAIFFSSMVYSQSNGNDQPVSNGYPKARIVTGCLISAVGIALLIESVRPAPGVPFFNPTEEQIKRQHTKFVTEATLGGLCLITGTITTVYGIHLLKKQKLNVAVTSNGIGLIYKL